MTSETGLWARPAGLSVVQSLEHALYLRSRSPSDRAMTTPLKIDFVSDVSCPWCIVGLGGLEAALERVGARVDAEIRFQPFELNPNMPPEGQNIVEHVAEKYGATREQSA